MYRLTPPPKRIGPDAFELELHGMADSIVRGMPRVPSPPNPPSRSRSLARRGPQAIERDRYSRSIEPQRDAIGRLSRVLLWVLLALVIVIGWALWRS